MKTPGMIPLFALALAPLRSHAQSVFWLDLSGDWRIGADDRPDYARPNFEIAGTAKAWGLAGCASAVGRPAWWGATSAAKGLARRWWFPWWLA
jgi:hypothetical protein